MNPEIKSVIEHLVQIIEEHKKAIEENAKGVTDVVCTIESLHKKIDSLNIIFKKISYTLSKITLLLSERPLPSNSEMTHLYSDLQTEVSQFVSILISLFSLHCGTILKQTYKQICMDTIEAISDVLRQIIDDVYSKEKLLRTNGCVWECGNHLQALPKDIVEFSVMKCQTEYDALVDAEEELTNEIKEHEESDFHLDETSWTDEDLKLLPSATGLIKTSYLLSKKIKESLKRSGKMEATNQVDEINSISEIVQSLSSHVDDLVTNLYAPIIKKQVFTSVNSLVNNSLSLIESLQSFHFIENADEKWIEILRNAIEHNQTNLLNTLGYTEALFSKLQITEIGGDS